MALYDKFIRNKHSEFIQNLTATNQKLLQADVSPQTLSKFWMVTPELEATRPNTLNLARRIHDILAASYCGYIAFLQDSGDDAINYQGHLLEVKLSQASSQNFSLGANGGLKYNNNGSWRSSLGAQYDISRGTDLYKKSQDTALVLWSEDHNCFISGHLLPKDRVYTFLTEREINCMSGSRVKRSISLHKFLTNGKEFHSPGVLSIGFEMYEQALQKYIQARDGMLNDHETVKWLNIWHNLPHYASLTKKGSL